MIVGCSVAIQTAAAVAHDLFDVLGPTGVSALRFGLGALVLLAIARPSVRGRDAAAWRAIVAYGVSLAVLNVTFFEAIDRIPMGIAVTLAFAGPLAMALVASRRRRDVGIALLATAGVITLGGLDRPDSVAGVAARAADRLRVDRRRLLRPQRRQPDAAHGRSRPRPPDRRTADAAARCGFVRRDRPPHVPARPADRRRRPDRAVRARAGGTAPPRAAHRRRRLQRRPRHRGRGRLPGPGRAPDPAADRGAGGGDGRQRRRYGQRGGGRSEPVAATTEAV